MRKKLIFILCLILIPTAAALTMQQDNCFNIPFECGNCTFVNITISYPNGSIIIDGGEMSTISGYYYNYTFCDSEVVGDYYTSYHYDKDSYLYADGREIQSTESGINMGINGTYFSLGFLFLLFGITGLFFYLSTTMKTMGFKTFFMLMGFLFIITAVMFSSLVYSQLVVSEGIRGFVSGLVFVFGILNIFIFMVVLVHYVMDVLDKVRDKKGFERDF